MTRIRWTLLLLALGIALPAAMIVQRAIGSLELENRVRHEAVADRVFDEMERSLTDFLLREESRPAAKYSARDAANLDVLRAENFSDSDEPFVVGWFNLDAQGQARLFASDSEEFERLRIAVNAAHTIRLSTETNDSAFEAHALAPGRTESLGRTRLRALDLDHADKEGFAQSNAYDVLQSLNRAQQIRSERKVKVLRKSEASQAPMLDASISHRSPSPTLALEEEVAADSAEPLGSASAGTRFMDDSAKSGRDRRGQTITDPLIGRSTTNGDIVLTRSVWRGPDVERQGLVVDKEALVAWLETRVVSDAGLSDRIHLAFGENAQIPDQTEVAHRYLHRFAEPFDAVVASLDLDDLPGLGRERPIYALALLLIGVATIGLLAVHRMTTVVVDYAERRSNFVAAVSHELKTPLTSIRMYAEMLRDGIVESDEKRAEYYTTITDESERLSRLIDNVLEFSRLEKNRHNTNLVVGHLPDAIREAALKLRAHVEREGFDLTLNLEEGVPAVKFDRDSLTQLIFNLVDNALKYARHAETRRIEITLRFENDEIELRVRDFGPGVPADQLRRVFEPFYRLGEELTRTTEGTGIGLALVRELAEKMGGRVRGQNAPGGGFEVCVGFSGLS